jgi:hypothetical protein
VTINTVAQKADQRLLEYTVGMATHSCVYPGIAQCFAIAGWSQAGMLCTHVSPGASKSDIDDTFDALRNMGGSQATCWYVVGPFVQHFAVAKAQWRSVKHIKKTFDNAFKNKTAAHFILDASAERSTSVLDPGFTIPRTFSSIDIKAERRGYLNMIVFSHKEGSMRATTWNRFPLNRFVRF